MKVMLINAIADRGSTGRICGELAEGILSSGNDVRFLYASGTASAAYAKKISNGFFIKANALLARLFGLNGYFCRYSTSKIIREVKTYKPDVIHLHNIHSHFLNLPRFLKFVQKNRIPLVITLHDCWFFTGKCMHYTSAKCENWKTICHDCPKLKQNIPSYFFDRTSKMFREKLKGFKALDRFGAIGVSNWITNEAKQSPILQNAIFTTIYNWIDTAQFHSMPAESFKESLGIPKDKKVIACVSNDWIPGTERYRDLLKLSSILPPEYVILVGGKTKTGDVFSNNIRLLGYLSIQNLARLYSNADVYVHLSREDTFGKVIVEALACGTPVVTYDSTVYREIVKERFLGMCVETGNLDKMAEAIRTVSETRPDRKKLTAYVEEHFSKEKLISDTIDFYQKICR